MMKKQFYVFALGLTLSLSQVAHATFPFCPTLKSNTLPPAFTNWKVLEVSQQRQPPVPPHLKPICNNTCLVLQAGEYSYWTYTYLDRRSSTVIIAYNRDHQLIKHWEINTLVDSLIDININPMARWIHFNGEKHQFTMSWQELTIYQTTQEKTVLEQKVTKDKQLPQNINFSLPSSITMGDPPFNLTANGGASGNPIVFESQSPTICTVNGTTLTPISAGECVIIANQEGNQAFTSATPVKQSTIIKPAKPVAPVSNNNAAPSKLCLSATGAYTSENENGRAGYCNDYSFSDSTVPCITAIKGNLKVGNCATSALMPKPISLMSLGFSQQAFIGNAFSAAKPRCDASTAYLETSTTKAPSEMTFVCFRYEHNSPNSFYYGLALVNNGQILSYQFETTPDKCIGTCPK